jgi:predicted dehydrogenase
MSYFLAPGPAVDKKKESDWSPAPARKDPAVPPIHRRKFLGTSAAFAAGLTAPFALAEDRKKVAASDKIRVALVGCGGMGRYNLTDFMRFPEVEIVGLCDVDSHHLNDTMKQVEQARRPTDRVKTARDFRKIVESKDVDAVIVGTPDHWHAYVLIAACANDKDVYCEKPLSHNIVEGRAMVNAAKNHKRVVQIGTQQRSGQHFIDAVKYVQAGKLGHVYMCRTWITNGSPPDQIGNPPDKDHAPEGVDYEMWLGPAPKHRFNPNRFHHNFRWFFDYGNGLCNDWGVHLNDVILWGMKVASPRSVSAVGGKQEMKDNSDTPDTLDIYYEYPGFTHVYTVRRGRTLFGFHGKSHGMEFEGTGGTLTLDRGEWFVTSPRDGKVVERHGGSDQHYPHVRNFLQCIRNRLEKTASAIEDMHHATVTAHLANISYKIKRRVYWNPANERCFRGYDPKTGKFLHEDGEANAYLLREPRKPWSLTV